MTMRRTQLLLQQEDSGCFLLENLLSFLLLTSNPLSSAKHYLDVEESLSWEIKSPPKKFCIFFFFKKMIIGNQWCSVD